MAKEEMDRIKALMISRSTLYSSPGGDTIQINETANFLRKVNISVDIKLTNEKIDYDQYDIIHFFNIIRPNDILYHLKRSNKPFVVSTIYVDYHEYERKNRGGIIGLLTRVFSSDHIEYLKTIARAVLNNEKIYDWEYIFKGHKKSIKHIIRKSSMLLPNSRSEMNRITESYGLKANYKVVPNAINPLLFRKLKVQETNHERSGVICVGRIEGRKNQLNLIRALNNTDYDLYIIGNPSPNTVNYYERCKKEAKENVVFVDHIDQNELIQYYKKSKVHILPSWFETTGLTSLEAGYLGCKIVVTEKGDTKEYFKDFAYYCEPDNIDSIRNAVSLAYNDKNNNKFAKYVEENYTWQKTAEVTKKAYIESITKN
ncbi:glycosyltransferase [Ascidiimonas aurantiaca]|uniref:glycosyltransferase family 4 protein n=1 Tax=Ascidiimonas aurantiaca TaxID=1685432 RepID=UPI0030EB5284